MSNIDMLRTCLEQGGWELLEDFVNGVLFSDEEHGIIVIDRESLINHNPNPSLFEDLIQEHADIFLEYTGGFLRLISTHGYPFDTRTEMQEIANKLSRAGLPATLREPRLMFPDCFEVDERAALFFEIKA